MCPHVVLTVDTVSSVSDFFDMVWLFNMSINYTDIHCLVIRDNEVVFDDDVVVLVNKVGS